jgi:F-type H+-transporting ATPase subunit b
MSGGQETWLSWVFKVVNFGVLVAVLIKFAGKPLQDFLAKRSKTVKDKIEESDRLLKEAEQLRAAYEEKLSRLEGEMELYRQTVIEETEMQRKKILDDAAAMAGRIREQARLMYEQELREVQSRIREEIAGLTMHKAQDILTEKMTKKDHDKMVEEFIHKLGSIN